MSYRVVEKDFYTDQPLRMWDTVDGHEMTALQAAGLLETMATGRPDLHKAGARTYLKTELVRPAAVLVVQALLQPDSSELPAEAVSAP